MKKFINKSSLAFLSILGIGGSSFAQSSFPCGSEMYLSIGDSLYIYSESGTSTNLFYVGDINALAFSTTGLMWAFDQTNQEVVIIGADGSKTPITVPGLPVGGANYNVGTIDTNGYYYLYNGQTTARFYIIDTDPSRSATYGQLVDPTATSGAVPYALDARSPKGTIIGPTSSGGANRRTISDWSINPLDGMLYAMTNSSSFRPNRIVSYNPVTGSLNSESGIISGDGIQNPPSYNTSYGAIFIDAFNNFYVFGNQRGHLYSLNLSDNSATQLSSTSISSSNIDGAICALSTVPLHIKLVNFDAQKDGNIAQLQWSTAHEYDNKGFEIERSTDGKNFTSIAFIKSLSENGHSSSRLNYLFTDNNPAKGPNFYRLKQTDFDGRFEYSPVRMLSFNTTSSIHIYPNPAKDNITIIGLTGTEQLLIYNNLGIVVHQQKADQSGNISLEHLSDGLYYVQIIDNNGNTSSYKVIKAK